MAKKLEVVLSDDSDMPRNGVNARFTREFVHVADTHGAPEFPERVKIDARRELINANAMDRILEIIKDNQRKKGVICISAHTVTHQGILSALKNGDSLVVMQKYNASEGMVAAYLKLGCSRRRNEFSGGIFPHLYRRDAQEDFGLMEAVRVLGDMQETIQKRQNTSKALSHSKILVALVPNSKGILVPDVGVMGSANLSYNAESSFETMMFTTDPKEVDAYYNLFGKYWSLSEGLYNYSMGLRATYYWDKKAAKFSKSPKCPACGSDKLVVTWGRSAAQDSIVEKRLRCAKCRQQMPFLREFQKNQY